MRLHLAAIIVFGALAASTEQLPLLDLTIPFDDGSKVGSGGGSVSSSSGSNLDLPLTVAIVELPDQTYTLGDSFQYEVTLTNNAQAALTIPWSGNPSWLNATPDAGVFQAGIVLTFGNGTGARRDPVFAAADMYGDVNSPASVHVLAPGGSVRIRASGQWSVSGVMFRDYLAATNGRAHVRARFHMTRGTNEAMTPHSEPRSVTLVMPPP